MEDKSTNTMPEGDTGSNAPLEPAVPVSKPEVFNASVPPQVSQVQTTATPYVMDTTQPSQAPNKNTGSKGRRIVFTVVLAAFLLIGGSVGAYFGVIYPNQPENVWQKAMSNTARGYDKLVSYTDSQKNKKSGNLALDFKVETNGLIVTGNASEEYDAQDNKGKISVDFLGKNISLEMLSSLKDGNKYPDIYLKAQGLDDVATMLGQPSLQSLAKELDNQWFVANSTFLEQMMQQMEAEGETPPQLTPEDIIAFEQAFGKVTKEYILTTEESKAVLKVAEFVGKEKMEDRDTHHFKVSVHKENLKAYLTALEGELKQTNLVKYLGAENFNLDSVRQSVDKIQDSDRIDIWVDSGTKLIRTVRVTDSDNNKNYFDFGLKYTGGDNFPFYFELHGDENGSAGVLSLVLNLNTKENKVTLSGSLDVSGEEAMKASLNGTFVADDRNVDVAIPEDATSIESLIQNLFGGFMSLPSQNENDFDFDF